jgi:type I restriction enzyme S subunit
VLIDSKYINSAVSTEYFYQSVLDKSTGSATPIINRTKWEELLVPIAPLEEQHRIVIKVNELMTLCDALKTQLNTAQSTQLQLADAMADQAVA